MTLLFKASLTQSDIRDTWREALIFPLFKGRKKDRNKVENYRPISLRSISCKVLEHILRLQHGFRRHLSCQTQLIKTLNGLAKLMNHGEQIGSIQLDFSKARGQVCHRK